METALENIEYSGFDELTDAWKFNITSDFLTNFPMDDTPAKILYTLLTEIITDIDKAIVATK